MPLNPEFVWVRAKASKNAAKPFYFYNAKNRKTVWETPDTSNGLTMVFTQEEYLAAIKSGELPKPRNQFTNNADNSQNQNAQLGNQNSQNNSQSSQNPYLRPNTQHKSYTDSHGKKSRDIDVVNEWTQNRSPDGRLYYYNKRTMETNWRKPDALKNWEDKQRKLGFDPKEVLKKTSQAAEQPAGTPIAREQIPGTAWVLVWTSDGKHFFFNALTKQSEWDLPADLENNLDIEPLLEDPPHLREDLEDEEGEDVEESEELEDSEEEEEIDENAELIEKLKELPLIERMDIFQELLAEKKLTKFSTYDLLAEDWEEDVRFKVLDNLERRRTFDNYLDMYVSKQEALKRKKTPKDHFFELLNDQNGKINKKSSFRDAQMRCAKDRRWDKVDKPSLRVTYFRDWQMKLKTGGKIDKLKEEFMVLLEENHATEFNSWAECKAFIKSDKRYNQVPSQAQRMAFYNEFLKRTGKNETAAVEKRADKVAQYRKEIEDRNAMFRNRAMVKDAAMQFDQILLDLYKHNASEFFRQGYIAKWENVKDEVTKDVRWTDFCGDLEVRDCERIFNKHVDEVIRKARKMLKQMLDEKLQAGSSFSYDDEELWASLWLQIKGDRRCVRMCGDNENFAKNEFARYQQDRFFDAKEELKVLFRETKLIDFKTIDKVRKDEKCNPGEKPATLKAIEDVLAFDARWHALKDDKLLRGRMLNEYCGFLQEQGHVDSIKEPSRPKAAKMKIL